MHFSCPFFSDFDEDDKEDDFYPGEFPCFYICIEIKVVKSMGMITNNFFFQCHPSSLVNVNSYSIFAFIINAHMYSLHVLDDIQYTGF